MAVSRKYIEKLHDKYAKLHVAGDPDAHETIEVLYEVDRLRKVNKEHRIKIKKLQEVTKHD